MVTNSFGTRNAMQPMGRLKHSLKAPCFFSFFPIGGGGGGGGGEGEVKERRGLACC